jgi:hypothetical protein
MSGDRQHLVEGNSLLFALGCRESVRVGHVLSLEVGDQDQKTYLVGFILPYSQQAIAG